MGDPETTTPEPARAPAPPPEPEVPEGDNSLPRAPVEKKDPAPDQPTDGQATSAA